MTRLPTWIRRLSSGFTVLLVVSFVASANLRRIPLLRGWCSHYDALIVQAKCGTALGSELLEVLLNLPVYMIVVPGLSAHSLTSGHVGMFLSSLPMLLGLSVAWILFLIGLGEFGILVWRTIRRLSIPRRDTSSAGT